MAEPFFVKISGRIAQTTRLLFDVPAVSHTSFETVDGFQKGESIGTEQNGIKGKVSSATKESRDWDRMDSRHYSKIMLDTSDGDVWVDTFISEGEFKRYRSSTIENIPVTDIIFQSDISNRAMTVDELDEAIVDYVLERCRQYFLRRES